MGAYLSEPVIEKVSEDFEDAARLSCGISQMQGWRISMEDAHNCVLELKKNMSLFGVYDGHGGSEVALYCALHFSDILKNLQSFKDGDYDVAMKETFMALDKALLKPETIRELRVLADRGLNSGPVTEEDMEAAEQRSQEEEALGTDEMKLLHEEATMTIEELLTRYGKAKNDFKSKLDVEKSKIEAQGSGSSDSESVPKMEEEKQSGSSDAEFEDVVSSTSDVCSSSDVRGESTSSCDVSSSSSAVGTPSKSEDDPGSSTKVSSTDESYQRGRSSKTESANTAEDNEAEVASENEAQSKGDPGAGKKSSGSGKIESASGKVQPKKIKGVKLGVGDDEDFDPGSDSESDSDDGFDSDEAVEGSSESDDEEEEEEEDEDIDESEAPYLSDISSMKEQPGRDSGTTAVVAFLNGYDLLVANAGDSRCVLCRSGEAFDMSSDHKPEDTVEIERINAAGGHVNMQGRVNGGLNVSRAIGDHCYKANTTVELEKQMISAMPDIKKVTLRPGDDFIVLACDGIWNVLTSQDVVNFVRARLPPQSSKSDDKMSVICEELMDACIASDTAGDGTGCDNMTCIVVRFNGEWLARSELGNTGCLDETPAEEVDNKNEVKNNGTELKINGNGDSIEDSKSVATLKRPRTESEVKNEIETDSKKQKVTEE